MRYTLPLHVTYAYRPLYFGEAPLDFGEEEEKKIPEPDVKSGGSQVKETETLSALLIARRMVSEMWLRMTRGVRRKLADAADDGESAEN